LLYFLRRSLRLYRIEKEGPEGHGRIGKEAPKIAEKGLKRGRKMEGEEQDQDEEEDG